MFLTSPPITLVIRVHIKTKRDQIEVLMLETLRQNKGQGKHRSKKKKMGKGCMTRLTTQGRGGNENGCEQLVWTMSV